MIGVDDLDFVEGKEGLGHVVDEVAVEVVVVIAVAWLVVSLEG